MKVCGVELSASEARIVIIDGSCDEFFVVPCSSQKIALIDDESSIQVRSFYDHFDNLIKSYAIDDVAIKKRRKKGKFAGGAVSFKLEAIIQLLPNCDVCLVDAATISAYTKKNPLIVPSGLHTYQQIAFDVARTVLGRSGN